MDLLELARAHIEAENLHDLALTMSTIASGGAYYKMYANNESFTSRDDISRFYADSFAAIPDMNIEIRNAIVDESRRQVFMEYTLAGINAGSLSGLAPTNKPVRYDGAILYEFDESGKLTREVSYFDKTDVLSSMGVIRNPNTKLGMFLLIFPQSPIFLLRTVWRNIFKKKEGPAGAQSKAASG
jgi:steroid delta-isomerase-like uncharacterized protein